ncbi:glycosyltransferase [Marmoricola sp. URHB0036]|uniref:glycosyltransferase n=1 Tax=Marmoricola sp. URHB0036 TaxID=1298863 RepID=UPI0003F6FDA2|nr:glycosyltransferase [Marmoricola sp. URHB0036]
MIGYYVHHQGRGHLHHAQALAAALDEPVTGLSSLARPSTWRGPWVELPRDDTTEPRHDVTAGDQLHWVPLGDPGLRSRSAAISEWIESTGPRGLVVDVSVEVALLARLHGLPVVSVVLPGRRTDPTHLLGYRASSALVAMWPAEATGMTPALPQDVARRVVPVGAVSRLPVLSEQQRPPRSDRRHVVLLQGLGGEPLTRLDAAELEAVSPGWTWTVLGGEAGWTDDLHQHLLNADVVVTHAGMGALADVAACRRPAVVVPAARPHREQVTTAAALADGPWPAVVLPRFAERGWTEVLDRAAELDGMGWARWCDGRAAQRFAQVVAEHLLPETLRHA